VLSIALNIISLVQGEHGLMEFVGVDKAARLKMWVWKMQEWTYRHDVHPCHTVPICPLLHYPPLQHGPHCPLPQIQHSREHPINPGGIGVGYGKSGCCTFSIDRNFISIVQFLCNNTAFLYMPLSVCYHIFLCRCMLCCINRKFIE